jgi:hypothetical protein
MPSGRPTLREYRPARPAVAHWPFPRFQGISSRVRTFFADRFLPFRTPRACARERKESHVVHVFSRRRLGDVSHGTLWFHFRRFGLSLFVSTGGSLRPVVLGAGVLTMSAGLLGNVGRHREDVPLRAGGAPAPAGPSSRSSVRRVAQQPGLGVDPHGADDPLGLGGGPARRADGLARAEVA